jgi:uncharacterized protein YpuA (DUF1002 family)
VLDYTWKSTLTGILKSMTEREGLKIAFREKLDLGVNELELLYRFAHKVCACFLLP